MIFFKRKKKPEPEPEEKPKPVKKAAPVPTKPLQDFVQDRVQTAEGWRRIMEKRAKK